MSVYTPYLLLFSYFYPYLTTINQLFAHPIYIIHTILHILHHAEMG